VILHLVPAEEWAATTDPYAPVSLAAEGFVHATDDEPTLVDVANRFYRDVPGEVLVLVIDEALIEADVRREAATHPDGSPTTADEPLFPHVYGPIPRRAVAAVRRMQRTTDGAYEAIVDS
jgi:uncharacterized protein (DUF952 family)